MTDTSIHIDKQFQSLLPALEDKAVEQLVDSLRTEGCREPLVVWEYDGKHILLDGHNRYTICDAHRIPYQVVVKTTAEILDRDAAMDWIDRNQLARRNLTPEQFTLVLGRLYNRQKQTHGGDRKSSGQNDHLIADSGKTAEQLAKTHGVSEATVRRAGKVVRAIDTVKPQDPDIEAKVIRGEVSRKEVIEKASPTPSEGAPPQPKDAVGRVIPESLRDLYQSQGIIKKLLTDLRRIHDTVQDQFDAKDKAFALLHPQSFHAAYQNLCHSLKAARFYAVCPYCGGDPKDCKYCHGVGFVNRRSYELAPREYKS